MIGDQLGEAALGDAGLTASSVVMLVLGWVVACVIAFFAADALAARFFDLPLGAFLAGQGTLVGAVVAIGLCRRGG